MSASGAIGPAEMLKLKLRNRPTVYNDMVGRAVTLRIEPANPEHPRTSGVRSRTACSSVSQKGEW